ncbi:DUF362 domain-containing protein [Candidatus Methanoperedens nitratireducens]|uniref:DUF362 domain-containing protein n=1 Tax=Candidatus Methanoperedens nitratireducens TaxID=1392998 RepID=A0A284VJ07_9EURY|nr:DUF362 domain-containing protein [Candidatus Methanoperedens nitroreducens]SNQ59230.1 hypothetical protein MNV_1100007 [Candidatus Methanoperedens nitroreducens]
MILAAGVIEITNGGITKVVARKGEDKFSLLEQVLEESGFWESLEKRFLESNKTKNEFLIAIKPNMMMAYSRTDKSVITDPELVEYLVNHLTGRGYTNIALVESKNTYGVWFKNREVDRVAAFSGYTGKNYRIVDLTGEAVAYDYGGYLGAYFVGKTWKDADFRVSFAKNKTHFQCYFTLCVKNIYGTTPEENKFLEYHRDREFDLVTIDMLKAFPVHFGIIDATVSSDGVMGLKADYSPKYTKTIIAGPDIVAVDQVGAEKMGIDPMKSRFHRFAVQEFGLPDIERTGDMSVYPDWDNVPEHLDDFFNLGEEWHGFFNFMGFVSAEMDPSFPPRMRSRLVLGIRRMFLSILKLISRYE